MKHIFKIKRNGTEIDETSTKKRLIEINNELANLDLYIDKKISKLLLFWTSKCFEYQNFSNKSDNDRELDSLNSLIPTIQRTIKGIRLYKKLYSNAQEDEVVDNEISVLNECLKRLKNKSYALRGYKGLLHNKCLIKRDAILAVFQIGEDLGLSANTKRGAGRGNKNRLFYFVRIFTNLSKASIHRYFKIYKHLKLSNFLS